MKRLFDFSAALLLLICLSPILSIIALLVKIKLGSPIVFKQQRPGLHGEAFYLYKFRTMTSDCNEKGQLLSDHLRLTPFGRFLRKYSLDELVQLFNVVKGDLSLVGPRPLLMEYLPLYTEEQAQRHQVKPGITGWAQVNGRNAIEWDEKFQLDVWYVKNQSFYLDLKVIFLTVIKVVKSEGIQNEKHVTMPYFRGDNHYEG